MIPFKSIFEGKEQPIFKRVVTSQRCIRTKDIDRVGITKRHLTGFTMLGNFSFGDYFKEESILMGYTLVTEIYKIEPKHLIVTVHPEDYETQQLWIKYLPKEQILLTEENVWSSGEPGVLGKCTEIFYNFEPDKKLDEIDLDSNRFLEFYNIVFVDSKIDKDGNISPTSMKCVDSGLGLERLTYILGNKEDIYQVDCFNNEFDNPVIKDHYRTCHWIFNEGVNPSNTKHGYVLRKLMRRMFRIGYKPKHNSIFYLEYLKYQRILTIGTQKLQHISQPTNDDLIHLYQTYGIPVEISKQILNTKHIH